MTRSACISALLIAATLGCGGRQSDDEEGVACDANLPPDLYENFVRHPVDTNGDCEPDFWKLYDVADDDGEALEDISTFADPANYNRYRENRRIRQKWLDVNFDGTVDVIRYYDTHGRLAEQDVDLDFDGGLDRTDRFDEGVVNVRESDENGDGVTDVTRYYRGGALHRMEIDSDFDGTPDTWRFYEDGHLLRIGQDTDGDDDIDQWLRRPTSSGSLAAPPGSTPAPPEGSGDAGADG